MARRTQVNFKDSEGNVTFLPMQSERKQEAHKRFYRYYGFWMVGMAAFFSVMLSLTGLGYFITSLFKSTSEPYYIILVGATGLFFSYGVMPVFVGWLIFKVLGWLDR